MFEYARGRSIKYVDNISMYVRYIYMKRKSLTAYGNCPGYEFVPFTILWEFNGTLKANLVKEKKNNYSEDRKRNGFVFRIK